MSLRARFTVLFSIITLMLFCLFSGVIYFKAEKDREKEFYTLLKKEATTKANLWFETGIDAGTLQRIYQNNRQTINEVEVAIYNSQYELLYHDAVEIDLVKETPEMLGSILKQKNIQFYQGRMQVIGMVFSFKEQDYIISATAIDEYGYTKLRKLRNALLMVLLVSAVTLLFAGYIFSKNALKPIERMAENAKTISAGNLYKRLSFDATGDELAMLGHTFNQLLSRLETSFEAQKQFVHHLSHELKNPLAALIAELEWLLQKYPQNEAYRKSIEMCYNDAIKLSDLTENIFNLARASYDTTEVKFKKVRVDELLLEIRLNILKKKENYQIDLIYEQGLGSEELLVNGNSYLLGLAFQNIMDNACKFSSPPICKVLMGKIDPYIILEFSDQGIGISREALEHIFEPFYRSPEAQEQPGSGIGLSLVKKIIELHNGKIKVSSTPGLGTQLQVKLKAHATSAV